MSISKFYPPLISWDEISCSKKYLSFPTTMTGGKWWLWTWLWWRFCSLVVGGWYWWCWWLQSWWWLCPYLEEHWRCSEIPLMITLMATVMVITKMMIFLPSPGKGALLVVRERSGQRASRRHGSERSPAVLVTTSLHFDEMRIYLNDRITNSHSHSHNVVGCKPIVFSLWYEI